MLSIYFYCTGSRQKTQRQILKPWWVKQPLIRGRVCCSGNQDVYLNVHWPNSSQIDVWPSMKIQIGKCIWSPVNALSTHLRSLCSGRAGQNRGPVWSPQQSQQRISVFLTQHFPCTNSSTHSATQSPTNDKQRASSAQLWSQKNWLQFVLIQLAMPDIFLKKIFIPTRTLKRKFTLIRQTARRSWAALLKDTPDQPCYGLTRREKHTSNSHLLQQGSHKTNNNIKEVTLPMERFEGTVIGTGPLRVGSKLIKEGSES